MRTETREIHLPVNRRLNRQEVEWAVHEYVVAPLLRPAVRRTEAPAIEAVVWFDDVRKNDADAFYIPVSVAVRKHPKAKSATRALGSLFQRLATMRWAWYAPMTVPQFASRPPWQFRGVELTVVPGWGIFCRTIPIEEYAWTGLFGWQHEA